MSTPATYVGPIRDSSLKTAAVDVAAHFLHELAYEMRSLGSRPFDAYIALYDIGRTVASRPSSSSAEISRELFFGGLFMDISISRLICAISGN
jgi:hypothetical protein